MTDVPSTVLLVEDDDALRTLVADRLRDARFTVREVATGPDALKAVEEEVPALVLLDVMLPGMDGLEVCRRLRQEHPLLYICMLTARADEVDRVVGLEVGADDYVTKPFSLHELVARVRAVMRRLRLLAERTQETSDEETEEPMIFDSITIDPLRRSVHVGDDLVHLTVREFDLICFLAHHPGQPFTRAQLLDKVWDIQYEGYDRTIDSHIQRLRAKVEVDPGNPQFIRTVWGVGYKFRGEDEA